MGAIFLTARPAEVDLFAIAAGFTARGFRVGRTLRFGPCAALVFAKQKREDIQFFERADGAQIVAVGTLGYRGRSARASLAVLLDDAARGELDWDELIGAFCVVVWDGRVLRVFNDRLQVQPIFVDAECLAASTSFLALLTAQRTRRRINRPALLEKLVTGFVIGPDTLAEGLCKATRGIQDAWTGRAWQFLVPPPKDLGSSTPPPRNRADAIAEQNSALATYLRRVVPFAGEAEVVLATSAGYDSRLLLAAAEGLFPSLRLQTHATAGVHDVDRCIVETWAQERGYELVAVPTKPMIELDAAGIDAVAEDCVQFFDGRSSHNMGAMSPVYTRGYSIASLGGAGLRLNGLGGELYRNYYFSSRRSVDLFEWMVHHVYYPASVALMGHRSRLREVHESVVAKMARQLDIELGTRVDQSVLRRIYSEIRMPECDGVNSNAHNQVALYLMPFVEWSVIRTGYRALRHLGLSGRFQADLIESFSPRLAGGASHYGFPLNQEPLSWGMKAGVKGWTPDWLWNLRTPHLLRGRSALARRSRFLSIIGRSEVLSAAIEEMQALVPEYRLDAALLDYAQGPNLMFVAVFLKRFSSWLSL